MKILILGGTRFAGHKLVCELAEEGLNCDVVSKRLTDFHCENIQFFCGEKQAVISRHGFATKHYDLVIDFTIYSKKDSDLVLSLSASRVLMVSSLWVALYNSGFNRTWSDIELNYIRNKKFSEDQLLKSSQKATILRLPVIAGGSDHTARFQKSIYLAKQNLLFRNEDRTLPLCLLDVDSVSTFVSRHIQKEEAEDRSIINLVPSQIQNRQSFLNVVNSIPLQLTKPSQFLLDENDRSDHAYSGESFELSSFIDFEGENLSLLSTKFEHWVPPQCLKISGVKGVQ